MDKEEFLEKIPPLLIHKDLGTAELQVLADIDGVKGAGYRNGRGELIGETFASSWDKVYKDLLKAVRRFW